MNIQIKDSFVLAAKIIVFVLIIVLVYIIGVYGRSDIPVFEIKDVYVKLSANANYLDDNMEQNWNLNIYQTNDIYIKFGHKDNIHVQNEQDKILKQVYIDNIEIVDLPKLGSDISVYTISKNKEKIFEYTSEYVVKDKIEYTVVPNNSDIYNLEVNSTNGQVAISFVNNNVLEHVYNGLNEIKFDGTLLKNANVSLEDVQFTVSFNMNFVTETDKKYVYNIKMILPYGDMITNGTVITDDMSNISITLLENIVEGK